MHRSCNVYLELSAADPDDYWNLATTLTKELDAQVKVIASARRAVKYLKPGTGALPGGA